MKRLLLVHIAKDLRSVRGHAVNGIVIVEPLVYWAEWVAVEKIVVHGVKHVLKVTDFPISSCCTIWSISEA